MDSYEANDQMTMRFYLRWYCIRPGVGPLIIRPTFPFKKLHAVGQNVAMQCYVLASHFLQIIF